LIGKSPAIPNDFIPPAVGVHCETIIKIDKQMRILTILLFLTYLTANGQTDEYKYWVLTQRLPNWAILRLNDLKIDDNYKISDYMNPFYLEADFNGDKKLDIAFTIIEKDSHKKGFIIIHQDTNDYFVIGAGKDFGNGGDDFNWMDIWKLHRELQAHELTYKEDGDIDDSKDLLIKSTGITVEKSESASGLIYWDGEKYKWAQTSD